MWTLRTRLRRCWLGQIRKDRAFRSVIPVAVVGQMLEPEFKILSARRIPAPADAPQGCIVKATP